VNLSDNQPLGVLDPLHRLIADRQDEQVLVQCAVVLAVLPHDRRHVPLDSREEDRRAGHSRNASLRDLRHECFDRYNRILKPGYDRCGSEMPDKHDAIDKPGQPISPLRHLREVGARDLAGGEPIRPILPDHPRK
jgi:hypothetical protein